MASAARTYRKRSAPPERSFTILSISFAEKSITSRPCAVKRRPITSCSMPPPRQISSWSARAVRAIPACLPRSIAPSHRWAAVVCATGSCSRSAISRNSKHDNSSSRVFCRSRICSSALRESLRSIRDLERASGRLSQASGNPRDLVALKVSLEQIPPSKRSCKNCSIA